MTLKKPYGMVLESLGKTNSSVPAIMRAQDAATDPQQQVKEADRLRPVQVRQGPVGTGEQGGLSQESPTMCRGRRARRLQSFAGSKFPGVDRIELVWISDPQTAMSALINGEIDFYENPNIDFYPILEKAKDVKLMPTGKLDSHSRHDPPQPSAPALQQHEGAAGHVLPHQPGGLPARH